MPGAVGHDKKSIQHDYLKLSVPFNEGSGSVYQDIAKPHHSVDGNMTWSTLSSGMPVITFAGGSKYADSAAAGTADMNIITQDYSIVGWIYHTFSSQSQIIIGRYGVDLDGWELYLFDTPPHYYLTLRHHHGSLAPDTRDGCYTDGWEDNTWYLFGISRSGLYPQHFRNGVEIEATYDTGGLKDPDTCNRDLVIGCRYTKNADWYYGYQAMLRVWVGQALTAEEHRHIFNTERRWFGV